VLATGGRAARPAQPATAPPAASVDPDHAPASQP
jgi:hypothetical protein